MSRMEGTNLPQNLSEDQNSGPGNEGHPQNQHLHRARTSDPTGNAQNIAHSLFNIFSDDDHHFYSNQVCDLQFDVFGNNIHNTSDIEEVSNTIHDYTLNYEFSQEEDLQDGEKENIDPCSGNFDDNGFSEGNTVNFTDQQLFFERILARRQTHC